MTAGVILDLGHNRALVGNETLDVRVAAGSAVGALRVGTAVLRPLRFGERTRLVAQARSGGIAAVGQAVLATACLDGEASGPAVEALALHLAGARDDQSDRLGFCDAAAAVAHSYGWRPAELAEADAMLVDDLAAATIEAHATDRADGWTRVILDGSAPVEGVQTAAAVRDRLCADLVRRGATPLSASRRESVADRSGHQTAAGVGRWPSTERWPASHPQRSAPGVSAEDRRAVVAERAPLAPRRDAEAPVPPSSELATASAPGLGGPESVPGRRADEPSSVVTPTAGTSLARRQPVAGAGLQPAVGPQHRDAHLLLPGPLSSTAAGASSSPLPPWRSTAAVLEAIRSDAAPTAVEPTAFAARASTTAGPDIVELGDQLAAALDEQADLRGLHRP
jgi:hypothetical protein